MNLPVKPGDVVGGKYRIEALLGAGGMGTVFLANHEQLRRNVAIKFLLSEAMSKPEAFARFEREAHAAAALQSDNVTRVLDMGSLPGGTPYIVMEYLEGEDLAARLAVDGKLPIEQAVAYIIEACDALSEAHALGIVHRDLKPANLFLARRPNGSTRVKVLDFGISKMIDSGKPLSLTDTGAVMGSPLYMSPEQLRGSGKVDERSDIWSLGVVLYEFLDGAPPFMADAFPEQCALILTAPIPPLREKRPEISPRLEAVVMRCLTKDASGRFAHVGELTAALLAAVPNPALGASSLLAASRRPAPVAAPTRVDRSGRDPSKVTTAPTLAVQVTPGKSPSGGPPPFGSVTAVPVSRINGLPMERSRRALGVGIAIAATALGGVLGVVVVTRSGTDGILKAPSTPTATAAAAAPAPAPLPSSIPLPPPDPGPPPPAAAPAAAAPPPPASSPSPPHRSAPAPRPRRPSAPAPAPAPAPEAPAPAPAPAATPAAKDCSTPYYFDAQGNKVFKPDCLK